MWCWSGGRILASVVPQLLAARVSLCSSARLTHHNSRPSLHEVEHLAHINDRVLGFSIYCAQEIQRHR